MNLVSLLLRVVLCISLVANGTGVAEASARMQFQHAMHNVSVAEHAPASVDPSVPPCHRHAASATAMRAPAHAGKAGAHLAASSHPGKTSGDDCCKGKTCKCACAHASCAAITASTTQAVERPDVRVAVLTIDHPQPRLPHLIRPPIG